MSKFGAALLAGSLAIASVVTYGVVTQAKMTAIFMNVGDIAWKPAGPPFPAASGVRAAAIDGNPALPGEYTLRLSFPAGTKIPPHIHSEAERVTVLSGTIYVALGSKFDTSKGTAIGQGGYFMIPPKTPHYGWTKGAAIVQINATGPRTMTLLSGKTGGGY